MEASYSFQVWEASGGWCTRVVRGMHGCGVWKNIRKGAESFFGHVLYAVGQGFRIRFWYDPQSSPIALKNLYPAMFAIAVDKAAMIFDMVEFASNGGCRSWNLRFCCAFQDWDIGIFDDFFAHISSKLPRGDDDTMI